MSEEWGPWIEHDGRGCPVRGRVVQCKWLTPCGEDGVSARGRSSFVVADDAGRDPIRSSWIWTFVNGVPVCAGPKNPIIRYRVRKPNGLTILQEIAREVETPRKTLTDA